MGCRRAGFGEGLQSGCTAYCAALRRALSALSVCLERRVQLAGATPRLAAPLGIVVRHEVPMQDCGVVRILDLRAYGTYLGCNQPL